MNLTLSPKAIANGIWEIAKCAVQNRHSVHNYYGAASNMSLMTHFILDQEICKHTKINFFYRAVT